HVPQERSGVRGAGEAYLRKTRRITRARAHLRAVVPAEAPIRADARDRDEPATGIDLRIDGPTDGVMACKRTKFVSSTTCSAIAPCRPPHTSVSTRCAPPRTLRSRTTPPPSIPT